MSHLFSKKYNSGVETSQKLPNERSSKSPNSLDSLDDKDVWKLFKNGHEGAFKYIYDQNFHSLYTYGYNLCHNKELVKDCIKTIFVQLRNGGGDKEVLSIKYYLLKTLKWRIWTSLRKGRRLSFLNNMEEMELFLVQESHEQIIILEESIEEKRHFLKSSINQLPKKQRKALYFFYYEDLSYKEVAQLM
ncbi:MAG: sigma-70 family RNA polymerase sigma factor, partial [Cytophagales bacterium]